MQRRAIVVATASFATLLTFAFLVTVSWHSPSRDNVRGKPMMWASAGGGWRAMAAGMGFARSLHLAGALDDKSLEIAASNSGGSWFLTQFAFSPTFHNDVTGNKSMKSVILEWMDKQEPNLKLVRSSAGAACLM